MRLRRLTPWMMGPALAPALALAAALLLGAVPARAASNEVLVKELMAADRAFAAATLEKGLEGWTSFFTTDGVRLDLHGAIVQGLEAIREADGPLFARSDRRLVWEPMDAGSFSGGTLGFTRGKYTVEGQNAEGGWEALATGRYLSWWRRGSAGWKVLLDTGTPDPPPASPAAESPAAPGASDSDGQG
jgi:ketosteroid isomerase-like protein